MSFEEACEAIAVGKVESIRVEGDADDMHFALDQIVNGLGFTGQDCKLRLETQPNEYVHLVIEILD